MMQPTSYDFAIRRGSAGDYAAVIFALLQADGATPVPLAGAVATVTIALTGAAPVVLTSAPGGRMTLDPVAATVTWLPTQAETLAIAPGRIDTYDLAIAFSNGSVGPYLTGYLIGLDDGDVAPFGCGWAGGGTASDVKVIKVLVPGTPGVAGPAGPSGATPQIFPINAASSFTAKHSLSFTPDAWITSAIGEIVEADIVHAPGATTVIFAQPFTGTLYVR